MCTEQDEARDGHEEGIRTEERIRLLSTFMNVCFELHCVGDEKPLLESLSEWETMIYFDVVVLHVGVNHC